MARNGGCLPCRRESRRRNVIARFQRSRPVFRCVVLRIPLDEIVYGHQWASSTMGREVVGSTRPFHRFLLGILACPLVGGCRCQRNLLQIPNPATQILERRATKEAASLRTTQRAQTRPFEATPRFSCWDRLRYEYWSLLRKSCGL